MQRGLPTGGDHRQHWHSGPLVVGLNQKGQRPEMGRRPEKDDGKEIHRRQIQAAGYRRPADQRRNRAGRAADDDVAGRSAFQPQGIDENIEQAGAKGQPGGQPVHPEGQQGESGGVQRNAKGQGVSGFHPFSGHRAASGAPHIPVNVPVEEVVDGVGAAGGQGAAQPDPEQQIQRRRSPGGQEHTAGRRYQQQRNDFRLGQGQIIARRPANAGPAGAPPGQGGRRVGVGLELRRAASHPGHP